MQTVEVRILPPQPKKSEKRESGREKNLTRMNADGKDDRKWRVTSHRTRLSEQLSGLGDSARGDWCSFLWARQRLPRLAEDGSLMNRWIAANVGSPVALMF